MIKESGNIIQHFSRDRDADVRIFCFPYAGSGAHAFSSWAPMLPRTVDVVGINYWTSSASQNEDLKHFAKPQALVKLAGEIVEEMLPWLDMPYVFFGHSMGALVAYEALATLQRLHAPMPRALLLSAARAPHQPPKCLLHTLDDETFLSKVQELNGLPQEILDSKELLQRALARLRFDFAVCESYRKTHYTPVDVPMVVFHGTHDGWLSLEDSECWREHAGSGYQLRMIDGDHFYINTQRQLLLSQINEFIF